MPAPDSTDTSQGNLQILSEVFGPVLHTSENRRDRKIHQLILRLALVF